MSAKFPSSEKYILKKGRSLLFHEAMVQETYYKGDGVCCVLVSRKEPSGKFMAGVFLIDIFCLGIKNVLYKCHLDMVEYTQLKEKSFESSGVRKVDLVFAHNLIYGAHDYAEDLGFKPPKDFAIAEHILDPDLVNDGINEIEFGKDGKPYYIAGPYDDSSRIIKVLQKNIGEGNFKYLIPL